MSARRASAAVDGAADMAGGAQFDEQVPVVAGGARALGDRLPVAVDVSQEQVFILVLPPARDLGGANREHLGVVVAGAWAPTERSAGNALLELAQVATESSTNPADLSRMSACAME
jgi:hypothetical protein